MTDQPVDVFHADLSLVSDAQRVDERIAARYPRLDVLVNNAGLHACQRRLRGLTAGEDHRPGRGPAPHGGLYPPRVDDTVRADQAHDHHVAAGTGPAPGPGQDHGELRNTLHFTTITIRCSVHVCIPAVLAGCGGRPSSAR
ncbi:hypothetical protein [Streptomyces sp. CRN 30]|uniref:hypothetical protein n=1 Tax=Streptomyces sp. CRN 30 TaxID=3075613 RepID=UPI002A7FCEA7|nr:hypothetical protein [Streptomyces sp. CRN 30]